VSSRFRLSLTVLVLAVAAMLLAGGGKGCSFPTVAPSVTPLIVMLHEAKHGPLPSAAVGAANELTTSGREVRMVDDDVLDGSGEVPDWLKPALEPGRKLMGGVDDKQQQDDALILLNGDRVVKAIKMPATRPEIVEACK
jgi:hypothetical protein